MARALKFGGLLVINVVIAVIGTAVADTTFHRLIPSHSIAAVVWKECVLSILFALFIGFVVWRRWPNSAAKWTWVIPAVWFSVGLIAVTGRGNVFGQLFGFGAGSVLAAPDARSVRSFFLFTVPLIRSVFYSIGAYMSSILSPTPVADPQ